MPCVTGHRCANCKAVLGAVVLLLLAALAPPGCQEAVQPETDNPSLAAEPGSPAHAGAQTSQPETDNPGPAGEPKGLPRLVDLGAGKCIPCKMMAPILEDLKTEYAGSLEVVLIDVWQDKDAGEKYAIEGIPTQIFYDASGKELFRHEGFFAREEILAKWKELGIDLQPKKLDQYPSEKGVVQ